MYGIYANIWGILMVNVTVYSIHGSYGQWLRLFRLKPPIRYPHRDSERYANWIISDAAIPKNHQVDEGTSEKISEKYQSSTLHSPFYHDLNWIAGEHQSVFGLNVLSWGQKCKAPGPGQLLFCLALSFDADGSLSTLDRDFASVRIYPTVSKPKPKNILWIGIPMYEPYGIPISIMDHHGY